MIRYTNLTRFAGPGGLVTRGLGQWMNRSLIKSIQRAPISISGGTSSAATITAVDPNNSLLRYLGRTFNNTGTVRQSLILLTFTNSTTITASVDTSPGADIASVSFEVVEYWPGVIKSLQRGTSTPAGATATINTVNVSKTQVDWLGMTDTSTSISFQEDARLTLTNTTTVTFTYGAAGAQIVGYQVVEWY